MKKLIAFSVLFAFFCINGFSQMMTDSSYSTADSSVMASDSSTMDDNNGLVGNDTIQSIPNDSTTSGTGNVGSTDTSKVITTNNVIAVRDTVTKNNIIAPQDTSNNTLNDGDNVYIDDKDDLVYSINPDSLGTLWCQALKDIQKGWNFNKQEKWQDAYNILIPAVKEVDNGKLRIFALLGYVALSKSQLELDKRKDAIASHNRAVDIYNSLVVKLKGKTEEAIRWAQIDLSKTCD